MTKQKIGELINPLLDDRISVVLLSTMFALTFLRFETEVINTYITVSSTIVFVLMAIRYFLILTKKISMKIVVSRNERIILGIMVLLLIALDAFQVLMSFM